MEKKQESPTFTRTIFVWTDGETRLLLDKYASYLPEIGPMKQFRCKKDMWMKVASEFDGRSWKQCEDRYKTVIRRKKVAVENNTTSGAKRQKLDFEEELDKICKLDDSIEPAIQISSQDVIRKSASADTSAAKEKPRKQKSIQETLMEIATKKEEAKEKRHKERMERADRVENLMLKFMSENNQT